MNTLALKKYEPEPIEFIHALKGSPFTLIFWTVLLIWLGKTFAPCFKQSAPITKANHQGHSPWFSRHLWNLLGTARIRSQPLRDLPAHARNRLLQPHHDSRGRRLQQLRRPLDSARNLRSDMPRSSRSPILEKTEP